MPIPYAQAGVENGLATATCPECGEVFTGKNSKQAVHEYGTHYAEKHEVSIEEIVTALKAEGLDAYENNDLGPCLINVYAKGYDIHLATQFNRENGNGGWEAAADNEGEYTPLDDGPAPNAPVEEVVAWVVNAVKALPTTYRIVRFFRDDKPREVKQTRLTLEEAQAHCKREYSHDHLEGWFDGYEEE